MQRLPSILAVALAGLALAFAWTLGAFEPRERVGAHLAWAPTPSPNPDRARAEAVVLASRPTQRRRFENPAPLPAVVQPDRTTTGKPPAVWASPAAGDPAPLGALPDDVRALGQLVRSAANEDDRERAALRLVHTAGPAAGREIARLLQDGAPPAAADLARSLWKRAAASNDQDALRSLETLRGHSDPEVAETVADALADLARRPVAMHLPSQEAGTETAASLGFDT